MQANNIDEPILSALFKGVLEPHALSQKLGLPAEIILHGIESLQQLGYIIERTPYSGFILKSSPDVIIADEIRARLPGNVFARQLAVYRQTRSTNDIVFKAGNEGAAEGFAVLAEMQTHARGRKHRVWHAPAGNGIWLSLLFRPDWPLERASFLTYMAGVALCRSVFRLTGLRCGIKWPNDILLSGKKLAGILTETRGSGTRLEFAVAGIGCNFRNRREDFPGDLRERATSLVLEGASPELRRADLLVALLQEIETLYRLSWPAVHAEWTTLCLSIGKPVRVQTEARLLEGLMTGLEEDGSLLLRMPSGKIEVINSGEVLF
ncbi:MAG: biotin--[acetyl-CoA-carboxylase] ligase [Methylacidiphilales bacterium]|nr:biotin--[acetyl-CoA-carboxylase] ligase [Candidatus Methylacidiphilales bacterium]